MRLTFRTKLIGHSCIIVFITVLMSTMASVYLSREQIREQNQSRLEIAAVRFNGLICGSMEDLHAKFSAFAAKTQTTKTLLNCIQQDFFHFPSLPDLFEMVPEMGLDRYAFYFPTRFRGDPVLQMYFDRRLGGLVRVQRGVHTLYVRKGGEIEEEQIPDPSLYPDRYPLHAQREIRTDGKNIRLVIPVEYPNLVDASEYGSTFKTGDRIGFFILEKIINHDINVLDMEMGVNINVYTRTGEMVGGRIQLPDIGNNHEYTNSIVTLVDSENNEYDSLWKSVVYDSMALGYVSFSIPQSITHAKLLDTIQALFAIGVIAALIGICGALLIIRGILIPVNRLVQLVKQVADGELSGPLVVPHSDPEKGDEIAAMVGDMMRMTLRIRDVLREMDSLIHAVEEGNLKIRGNEEAFAGAWRELVIGINNVLDAFIEPFNRTSSYIDRISVGDIPAKITEPYKGDFNTIIRNLNMLIDATNGATAVAEAIAGGNLTTEVRERSGEDRMMQALNRMVRRLNRLMRETDAMIRGVGEGRLDTRANPEIFEGGWRDLILGVNHLVDGFSAELQRQMEELERFKSLLDQSHDAIFLVEARSGRLAYVNRTACRLLGYEREELLRMLIGDVIEEPVAREMLASFSEGMSRPQVRNPVITKLLTSRRAAIPVEISVQFVRFADRSYVVGVARDITDRKRAEAEILREKEKAERYFDTAAVMLMVLNTDGTVSKINRRGCDILDCEERDILGKHWFSNFVPESSRERAKQRFDSLIDGGGEAGCGVMSDESPLLTRSREERLIVWNSSRLTDEDGSVVGVLSSGEDVTERRRALEDKEKLNAQLRQLQKMESLGTLAGGIAHDFNNLLMPIIGYTELLMSELPPGGSPHDRLGKIFSAAFRARDLIQQILAFARQTEAPHQPLILQPIVKEIVKLLRPTLPSNIEIHIDTGNPCGPVLGDPTQIHQILMNLCTNAYHAMREKGGILAIGLAEISLSPMDVVYYPGLAPGAYVRLMVSDTGSGMEEKTIDRIFDPYFTTKQQEGGTGLGLAVVHGIVKQMKGYISVYSESGVGTVFHVYLPRIVTELTAPALEIRGLALGGNERILVVDDEELVLGMLTEMLQAMGYRVTARNSSTSALAAFRDRPYDFDLVITDMTMPNLTGLELSRELLGIRPEMPIIICTGFSEWITEKSVNDLGIRAVVMKPVVTDDLARAIQKAMAAA